MLLLDRAGLPERMHLCGLVVSRLKALVHELTVLMGIHNNLKA